MHMNRAAIAASIAHKKSKTNRPNISINVNRETGKEALSWMEFTIKNASNNIGSSI